MRMRTPYLETNVESFMCFHIMFLMSFQYFKGQTCIAICLHVRSELLVSILLHSRDMKTQQFNS